MVKASGLKDNIIQFFGYVSFAAIYLNKFIFKTGKLSIINIMSSKNAKPLYLRVSN